MFQAADGGTLFLDEVGAMPSALQSKILRAVESKEIIPIGTTASIRADVRILAATSTDLAEVSKTGRFMDALYYRLNVFEIHMPPLRERKEDIPVLVGHFVERFSQELKKHVRRVSDEAMAMLMAYAWPGNVRELENAIERAMILTDGDQIPAEALPLSLQRSPGGPQGRPLDLRTVLRRAELEHIAAVLALTDQDKVRAAKILGISLSSLYRKLEQPEPPAPEADAGAEAKTEPDAGPATRPDSQPGTQAESAPESPPVAAPQAAQSPGTPCPAGPSEAAQALDAQPADESVVAPTKAPPAHSPDRNKWRRAKPPF